MNSMDPSSGDCGNGKEGTDGRHCEGHTLSLSEQWTLVWREKGKYPLWDVTPEILCPLRGNTGYQGSPGRKARYEEREDLGWLQGECEALPQDSLAWKAGSPQQNSFHSA